MLLVGGCSSPDEPQASSELAPDEASASATDLCRLLKTDEVRRLLETSPGDVQPGLIAGMPDCQWAASADEPGPWVQVNTLDASEWALSLPDAFRGIEDSGWMYDAKQLRKFRKAVDLIKAGQDVDSDQACSLFSQMLELEGRPPGSRSIVNVIPNRSEPGTIGVSGQICTLGRYTSVSLFNQAGLGPPPPVRRVKQAMALVHRRAVL